MSTIDRHSTAQLIDGKAIAAKVHAEVRAEVAALRSQGLTPCLAVVLAGDDPASAIYVRNKVRACEATGVQSVSHVLPATTTTRELIALVDRLAADPAVHGILVQLPLPPGCDTDAVLACVPPAKDVDGFHPANLGALAIGTPALVACTPAGVMRLLAETDTPLDGARAVVLGRSRIVGRPMALLLLNANATVTVCHSRTRALADELRRADVVVAAIGRPRFVQGDWIRPGATVIDVGMNRLPDGTLCGDVDFDAVRAHARALTPVPGGVGPMTIAMLLSNTVRAARAQATTEARPR